MAKHVLRNSIRQALGVGVLNLGLMAGMPAMAGDIHATVRVDIPQQTLASALRTLAEQADLQILFAPDMVARLRSEPVAGPLSGAEALQRLLSGSDLEYVIEGRDTIVIQQRARPALQPVAQINAEATGPAPAPAASAPARDAMAAQPEDMLLDEVVVASSRVPRSGYTAPTPTTILDADLLDRRGAVNVAEVLNEIPSFKATQATQVGIRGAGGARQHAVGLRAWVPPARWCWWMASVSFHRSPRHWPATRWT